MLGNKVGSSSFGVFVSMMLSSSILATMAAIRAALALDALQPRTMATDRAARGRLEAAARFPFLLLNVCLVLALLTAGILVHTLYGTPVACVAAAAAAAGLGVYLRHHAQLCAACAGGDPIVRNELARFLQARPSSCFARAPVQ